MTPDEILSELRAFGLTYPGAHLKTPWPGHLDLAVKDKTFAFLSAPGEPFSATLKLPFSGPQVLERDGATPAKYGLARSGWVNLKAPGGLDEMKDWLDESYRAVAPKSLVKQIAPRAG